MEYINEYFIIAVYIIDVSNDWQNIDIEKCETVTKLYKIFIFNIVKISGMNQVHEKY